MMYKRKSFIMLGDPVILPLKATLSLQRYGTFYLVSLNIILRWTDEIQLSCFFYFHTWQQYVLPFVHKLNLV